MAELKELKNDVKRRVDLAKMQRMKPLDQAQGWISRVEVIEAEVDKFVNDFGNTSSLQEKFLGGCCSKNCGNYKVGKISTKKLKELVDQKSKGQFERVVEELGHTFGNERPIEPTVGLESKFSELWSCLGEDQVGIIGLYGMGGVGKTTLLTQINNHFVNTCCNFNFVIWVVASKDLKLENVLYDIGKRIGFSKEGWKNKSNDEKAMDIFRILNKKKFVLLLDDVRQGVVLVKAGVPIPNNQNGSKLIFTTRSQEVCGRMDAHKKIKVECLALKEAWELFRIRLEKMPLTFTRIFQG